MVFAQPPNQNGPNENNSSEDDANEDSSQEDSFRSMDKPISNYILASLNILSLAWLGDNLLAVANSLPEWVLEDFEGVWSEGEPYEVEPFEAAEFSPFLENFIADAQQYWANDPSEPLRSGIWTEMGTSGREIHLEAIALLVNERPMVLIESSEAVVSEKAKWLQVARRAQLEYLSQRRRSAIQAHQAELYDLLTGLHNRSAFLSQLSSLFETGQWSEQRRFAIVVLNLNRFSHLNNSVGTEAGDQILIAVAARIRECLRKHDIPARLGSDEFGILVNYTEQGQDVVALVGRLLTKLAEPLRVDEQTVTLTTSVGIAIREDWHGSAQELIGDADLAMRHARKKGQEGYALFEREMRSRLLEDWSLESDLHHAIERCELELWYQPVIDLTTFQPESFEALLRWVHPVHGMLSPKRFLPLAEASGLIVEIDQWVLGVACQTLRRWQRETTNPVKLTVNFSNKSLSRADWFTKVQAAVGSSSIEPSSLCLEVGEGLLLERSELVVETLTQLKSLGIAMAIDNCSTGYASLNCLEELSLDQLKIDGCFIDTMQTDGSNIVSTIIELAHKLNCGIAAKKVETVEQYRALQSLGCDAIQGYIFSQPVSVADAQYLIGSEFVASRQNFSSRGHRYFL
ncbi:MAG: bifunctional diguanylate cyclase/phosphodiesterase [Cyanobacteria bacterium P01_D01_bin.1]